MKTETNAVSTNPRTRRLNGRRIGIIATVPGRRHNLRMPAVNKTILATICLAVLMLSIVSTGTAQEDIVGVDTGSTNLNVHDPSNGSVLSSVTLTNESFTITGATGSAFDPTDGTLYILADIAGVGDHRLMTVDTITGVTTDIGNTFDIFAGITFNSNGTLYGVTGDDASCPEELYSIDETDGCPTFLAALGDGNEGGPNCGEAIAFNPDDGLIYHASGDGNFFLETIDPNNSFARANVNTTARSDAISGLEYLGGGIFFAADEADDFWTITTTGAFTQIGNNVNGADGRFRGFAISASELVLLGDVNLDGVVNLLDVAPFVDRISTGTFQAEADINGDGAVNLLDVAPFVALLSGG